MFVILFIVAKFENLLENVFFSLKMFHLECNMYRKSTLQIILLSYYPCPRQENISQLPCDLYLLNIHSSTPSGYL